MVLVFPHILMLDRKVKNRLWNASSTLPDLYFSLWILEAFSRHISSLRLSIQTCVVSALFLLFQLIHVQAPAVAKFKSRAVVPLSSPQGCLWLRPSPRILPCSWILPLFSWGKSKQKMPMIFSQSQNNWFCTFLMMSRKDQSTLLQGRDRAEYGSSTTVFILAPDSTSIYFQRWKRIKACQIYLIFYRVANVMLFSKILGNSPFHFG